MAEPDRRRLPIRRPPFAGVANRTLAGSGPDWNLIGHARPPSGAPNVLLVLIDDAGFGNPGTFGGPIATPNYTRIAEGGLKYNRFHVTALCSPTRAALLTGRNSHAGSQRIPPTHRGIASRVKPCRRSGRPPGLKQPRRCPCQMHNEMTVTAVHG